MAVLSCSHTVDEDSLGFYRPHHHYQIIQEVLISNDLDGMEDDVLWAEQHDKSDTDLDEQGDDKYDDTKRYNSSSVKRVMTMNFWILNK